jgi:predicted metalloprotease with PDZ domain
MRVELKSLALRAKTKPVGCKCPTRPLRGTVTILVFLALGVACGASADNPVRYTLDLRSTDTHEVQVEMAVPDAPSKTEIQFPAWTALYQIRDFVRDVENVRAECDGQPQRMKRVDLDTWRTGAKACSALVVRYSVYINEEGPFSSILDQHHAYLNLAMLLFYLPEGRDRPVQVSFVLPEGWKLATLLPDGSSPLEFSAANYDALVDSPVEAGNFAEFTYQQGGATYRVIVDADPKDYSSQRLLDSLQKITGTETAIMHETPFTRYTFLFHFLGRSGGGGMEHSFGTAISLPVTMVRDDWGNLEGLAAHEFFHAWNVKRIRPCGLVPVDFVHGNDTGALWFAEGVTSTYSELARERAGLLSRDDFYRHIAFQIGLLQDRPARLFQSVKQAGRSAWLEKYLDYQRPERSVSYYNKGELLGFLLDLGIRHATANRRGLDDVMRRLNDEFARRGRCYSEDDLRNVIRGLAPEFTNLDEFFRDDVSGTKELDYNTYFGYAGLRVIASTAAQGALGFRAVRGFQGPITVESVESDSNAARAGLRKGDVLTGMNKRPLNGLPDQLIGQFKPGTKVEFEVRRGDKTLNVKYALAESHVSSYRLEEIPNAGEEQLRVRQGWLEGKTQP